FVRILAKWSKESGSDTMPGKTVGDMIAGSQGKNPKLGFAVTVYEDQLDSPWLKDRQLPKDVRARVTRVSLYLHYRRNAGKLPQYVKRIREIFPGATVVGGVYAYDRSAYLPCAQGTKSMCSAQEESALFTEAFDSQLRMLKSGELGGIEFY